MNRGRGKDEGNSQAVVGESFAGVKRERRKNKMAMETQQGRLEMEGRRQNPS